MSKTLDPIDLEIIRHRLESINADAAETLARVSGSAIASEASDLNTVLMSADGTVISTSKFVVVLSTSVNLIVQDILTRYADNPGIRPGDQFLTNDPYLGSLHQPDVTVVAPIFAGDRLIAWSGSTVHEADVGGPGGGGINYAARSIFDEPTPIPPVKIVEGGTLRRDIERDYLARSRTPDMNSLDLLGQIAANRSCNERLLELCERYGADTVVAAMDHLADSTEAAFRRRLRELPEGTWRDVSFIEHEKRIGDGYVPNQVYGIRLALTNRDGTLELDYSASDDEAPGAVNAGFPSLANFSMAAVLIHLCQGLPWVPGAIWRVVKIRTRPGSIVSPRWPAGVAMSTGTSSQAIRNVVTGCIARLLDASDLHGAKAMASCQSTGAGGIAITGRHGDGRPFTTLFLDELTGGGGAKPDGDGTDISGTSTSTGATPSNLETNEQYYPVLYVARRELADSAGPGRFRGGVGAFHAYRLHRTEHSLSMMSMAQGLQHPATMGVQGGEPGIASGFAIAGNNLPVETLETLDDLVGQAEIATPPAGKPLKPGEILVTASQGGGGFGDPLERDPALVLDDVLEGLVSVKGAARDYGVVIRVNGHAEVDAAATGDLRAQQRRQRIGRDPAPRRPFSGGRRLSTHLRAVAANGGETVQCAHCGHAIGRIGEPLYPKLALREAPAHERFALTEHYTGSDRFRIRHFYCPSCATQFDVHVALAGEPLLEAMETAPPASP
jgi:N-methylhydantoinase B